MQLRSRLGLALVSGALAVSILPIGAAANGDGPVPVATGLNNPRGIAIGDDGSIYVAESGSGGTTAVEALLEGEPSIACHGMSGSVSRIDKKGNVRRIVMLPSFAASVEGQCDDPGVGVGSVGPSNVAAYGKGTLAVAMGLGGNVEMRDAIDSRLGTLLTVQPNGKVSVLADIVGAEDLLNPDGEEVDSNPYGVAVLPDGSRLVADAGANALFRVAANGAVESVATIGRRVGAVTPDLSCDPEGLPPAGIPIPAQAVTTSVEVGPDGAWYVGILTGFPFTRGLSDVFRVDPVTHDVTNVTEDLELSYITGMGFGPDGSLYVTEFTQADNLLEAELCGDQTPGAVWKIKDGVKTLVANVPLPGDVAVAPNGTVYVTAFSILPGMGQVWRLNP